jgi:hypothetical protein
MISEEKVEIMSDSPFDSPYPGYPPTLPRAIFILHRTLSLLASGPMFPDLHLIIFRNITGLHPYPISTRINIATMYQLDLTQPELNRMCDRLAAYIRDHTR